MMKCLLLVAVIVHMICSLYHYEELISCSAAFAPCPNLQRQCKVGIVSSFVMAVVDDDNIDTSDDNTFHPLGPPTFLSDLKVCETIATTSSSCRNHT